MTKFSEWEETIIKNYSLDADDIDNISTEYIVTFKDGSQRQIVENWTRVMGYYRPRSEFNIGKRQEHTDRKLFKYEDDDDAVKSGN